MDILLSDHIQHALRSRSTRVIGPALQGAPAEMKDLTSFRQKLANGERLHGLWVSLEAGAVTDVAAGLGLDWVVVDAALGHLDWSEAGEHLRALKRSRTVGLLQIGEGTTWQIDRAFELGADGIVVRGVKDNDCLLSIVDRANQAAVRAGAAAGWKHEKVSSPVVIPMLGPAEPSVLLDELLQAETIDAFFCDLLHAGPETAWKKQVTQVLSRNRHVAVVARSDHEILECQALGISMIGLGSDAGIIFEGMRGALASCLPMPHARGAS